jgi:hypothetical protein
MKRMNGITAVLLSLAILLSLANSILVFFVHIPANARLLQRTYFQAYGIPELLLVGTGVVIAALVAFLLYRQNGRHQLKAGGPAWGVSIAAMALGIIGVLAMPRFMFLVGILLIGACLSFSARQSSVVVSEQSPPSSAAVSR